MSALDTRASIAGHHDFYLSPLPLTGATAEAMEAWISEGVAKGESGGPEQKFPPQDRAHYGGKNLSTRPAAGGTRLHTPPPPPPPDVLLLFQKNINKSESQPSTP